MDTNTRNLRAWALHFAARGWHVFPITPRAKKPPVIDRWETRASTDTEQIHHWWRTIPHTIGIAPRPLRAGRGRPRHPQTRPTRTRPLGHPGHRIGRGVLRMLPRQHGTTVTPTYAVTTPSGGWHLYYTAPAGTPLRNTHDVIGWKIDTRAHGGYAIAAGSPIPQADTS